MCSHEIIYGKSDDHIDDVLPRSKNSSQKQKIETGFRTHVESNQQTLVYILWFGTIT